MTDPAPPPPALPPATGAPNRPVLVAVVATLAVMVVAGTVADALAPSLVNDRPALLILLNSRIRYLVLTVNQLEPVTYFTIGLLRNLASDPLFYLLGFWYGTSAVRWMQVRTRTVGELMGTVERAFGRWGAPLVFLMPNNPICLLAGAARMRPVVFLTLNVTGTIARLVGIMIFGAAFETPINWVLDFIGTYRVPLLVLSVAVVAFTSWRETRKGTSELEQLRNLERDVQADPTPHPQEDET